MKKYLFLLISILVTILVLFAVYNKIHNGQMSDERIGEYSYEVSNDAYDPETLIKQVIDGDFSNLKESGDSISEQIKRSYADRADYIDFIEVDLNGDNINELIWQEKENNYNENMKRIWGVFTAQSDGIACILWDVNDAGEYYFLSANRRLIYYTQYYGTYNYNGYEHYQLDDKGDIKYVSGLYLYNIYDFAEVDFAWWHEEHPNMLKEGTYYERYIDESAKREGNEEGLAEEGFLEAFEEMAGASFREYAPEWMG
jgi:hypothetical protein